MISKVAPDFDTSYCNMSLCVPLPGTSEPPPIPSRYAQLEVIASQAVGAPEEVQTHVGPKSFKIGWAHEHVVVICRKLSQ